MVIPLVDDPFLMIDMSMEVEKMDVDLPKQS